MLQSEKFIDFKCDLAAQNWTKLRHKPIAFYRESTLIKFEKRHQILTKFYKHFMPNLKIKNLSIYQVIWSLFFGENKCPFLENVQCSNTYIVHITYYIHKCNHFVLFIYQEKRKADESFTDIIYPFKIFRPNNSQQKIGPFSLEYALVLSKIAFSSEFAW